MTTSFKKMYAHNRVNNTKCFCKVYAGDIRTGFYTGNITVEFYLPKYGFSYKWGKWNPYIMSPIVRRTADDRKTLVAFVVSPHWFNPGDLYDNQMFISLQDTVDYLYNSYIKML